MNIRRAYVSACVAPVLLWKRTARGRNGSPDDLHGAVVFFASPASAYVTGQNLFVDGGFTALGLS